MTLFCGLFYYGFLFNAVWANWGKRLVIVCLCTLLADFLLVEVILEAIILFFSRCKGLRMVRKMVESLLAYKFLRNMN